MKNKYIIVQPEIVNKYHYEVHNSTCRDLRKSYNVLSRKTVLNRFTEDVNSDFLYEQKEINMEYALEDGVSYDELKSMSNKSLNDKYGHPYKINNCCKIRKSK